MYSEDGTDAQKNVGVVKDRALKCVSTK